MSASRQRLDSQPSKVTAEDASLLPSRDVTEGVIYGPTQGPLNLQNCNARILGLNILGGKEKVCDFNCVYCDLGPTHMRMNQIKKSIDFPLVDEIRARLSEALHKIHLEGPAIDVISISGNGEPTRHPDFTEVIKAVLEARDQLSPGTPINLLTNGSMLDNRRVIAYLNQLDDRIVKIDAGNEQAFKKVNSPLTRTTLRKVMDGIRHLDDVIIQSMFVQGDFDNTKPEDIDDWLEVVAVIQPKFVHIQGLSHRPGVPGLIRCDEDTLYSIAARLERKAGIKSLVTP